MKDTFVAKTGTSVADVKDCLYCLCRSSLTSSSWKLVAVPGSSVVVFWVRCVIEASLWCTGPPESAQAISLHPPASRTQVSPCFPHGRMVPGQSVWKWLEKMRISKRTFIWTFIIRSGCLHTFNLSFLRWSSRVWRFSCASPEARSSITWPFSPSSAETLCMFFEDDPLVLRATPSSSPHWPWRRSQKSSVQEKMSQPDYVS